MIDAFTMNRFLLTNYARRVFGAAPGDAARASAPRLQRGRLLLRGTAPSCAGWPRSKGAVEAVAAAAGAGLSKKPDRVKERGRERERERERETERERDRVRDREGGRVREGARGWGGRSNNSRSVEYLPSRSAPFESPFRDLCPSRTSESLVGCTRRSRCCGAGNAVRPGRRHAARARALLLGLWNPAELRRR